MVQKLLSSSAAVPVQVSLSEPSNAAKKMTTDQLCEWLRSIDIDDEYIQCFRKARIKGSALAIFDENNLEEIGVSMSYIRKQILVEFRDIK